ncbi:hypothetical protein J4Q44_G00092560, partial [Coregonus suidteri]
MTPFISRSDSTLNQPMTSLVNSPSVKIQKCLQHRYVHTLCLKLSRPGSGDACMLSPGCECSLCCSSFVFL